MKLVVENIDPVTLQREKWESYLLHVSKQIEIYSEEGMYIVNGKHVKQIKQVRPSQIHKKTIVLQNNHAVSLLIDNTELVEEPCFQIPLQHISLETTTFCYGEDKKSPVKLFVKALCRDKDIVPIEFYFVCRQGLDIDDPSIQETLVLFL